jgi:hypothetical protein
MDDYKYGGPDYSYLEFLGDVLLLRSGRDMEHTDCSQPPPRELWLDIQLERMHADSGYSEEERQTLLLTAKMADLLDDRKQWLMEEIQSEVSTIFEARRITTPA